jgi:hypothetical protein
MSVYFLDFKTHSLTLRLFLVSGLLPDKLLCSFQGSDWINPAFYLGLDSANTDDA